MKLILCLLLCISHSIFILKGQDDLALLTADQITNRFRSEEFVISNSESLGFALIQPGKSADSGYISAKDQALLTSLAPGFILEMEPILPTSSVDSQFRSEPDLASLLPQNYGGPNFGKIPYMTLPRNKVTIQAQTVNSEEQVAENFISNFSYRDVHILTLGIHQDAGKISQTSLNLIQELTAQEKEIRRRIVILSLPDSLTHPLIGLSEMEKILSDKPYTIILPQTSAHFISGVDPQAYSWLRKMEHGPQLYWISLYSDKPALSQLILPEIQENEARCKEILHQLSTQVPIKTHSLWQSHSNKAHGYLEIEVKNPSQYAVQLNADFLPHESIMPSMDEIETTIYPGSNKTLRIQLQALKPLDFEDPPVLDWAWSFVCMHAEDSTLKAGGILPISLTSASLSLLPQKSWEFLHPFSLPLNPDMDNLEIRYTLNGQEPTPRSSLARDSLLITRSGTLKLKGFHPNGSASQTESCELTRITDQNGAWQDLYPVNSSFSIGTVSSLLANQSPIQRKAIDSEKHVPIASPFIQNSYVQVLSGYLHTTDTTTLSLDVNRLPHVVFRVDQGDLMAYSGEPVSLPIVPGKHLVEIISLEKGSSREIHPKIRMGEAELSLSQLRRE